jgi:hypothetical protein
LIPDEYPRKQRRKKILSGYYLGSPSDGGVLCDPSVGPSFGCCLGNPMYKGTVVGILALGGFHTNYIICRNVENFKMMENEESFRIFQNVNMENLQN